MRRRAVKVAEYPFLPYFHLLVLPAYCRNDFRFFRMSQLDPAAVTQRPAPAPKTDQVAKKRSLPFGLECLKIRTILFSGERLR